MEQKKTELLAPAGGIMQLAAAVENGADAVYLGGSSFNARINADNFTEEEIRDSIRYAHLRNVKIYVALNTLVADGEMLPALRYAAKLYEAGADALIVQDLGLASQIRRFMPDFPLHLSTQGTIYNLSGVRMAAKMGFRRVVLARELSLEEIKRIAAAGICELEVFVHGALCMCYSGQCQMSRALGDGKRSGNRGLCAQPCRLPYKGQNGQTAYALSPKDLCALDAIGALADAKVASLKIEGRMKFPEYVAAVTRIYRKYLDLHRENGSYQVSEEDRRVLSQVFNRGSFTDGYLRGNPGKDLLSGELPKHQGICIGTVLRPVKGKKLVDIRLKDKETLELGDGVEIRSKKLTGNVVTFLKPQGRGILRIGDIKDPVAKGNGVYRITQNSLMKSLRQSYQEGGPYGKKHKRTIPATMSFVAKAGEPPTLTVSEGTVAVCVSNPEILTETAQNRPLDSQRVCQQLRKTGNAPFRIDKIAVELGEHCSLPVSALNKLRRQALQELAAEKLRQMETRQRVRLPQRLAPPNFPFEKRLAFYFYRGELFESWDFQKTADALDAERVRAYVPLRFFMERQPERPGVEVVPYILNVSKGKLDAYIEENMEAIVDAVRECGIAIGNLAWLDAFLSCGVTVYGDYGLNLYNRWAIQWAVEQGILPVSMSHEAWNPEDGAIPLMISEHLMDADALVDRKNQAYTIIRNPEKDKTLIFADGGAVSLGSLKKRWEETRQEIRVYVP